MSDQSRQADALAVFAHPAKVAYIFFRALLERNLDDLLFLVTPESAQRWGRFDEAYKLLRSMKHPSVTSRAEYASGDRHVAYVGVFQTPGGTVRSGGEGVLSGQVITLVWRKEHGRWMVHHFGDYELPENVPHRS